MNNEIMLGGAGKQDLYIIGGVCCIFICSTALMGALLGVITDGTGC